MKTDRHELFIICLTLLVFALSTSGQSGTFYRCVNSKGSVLLTDSPTDPDYKCTVAAYEKDPTPQERAKEEREIKAYRQRMNVETEKSEASRRVQTEKSEASRRVQTSRNERADKLKADASARLQAVKDAGVKFSQSEIDRLEKAAEVKAEQIRQGTDTPMTAQEDADFHARQSYKSEMRKKEWEITEKQWEIDRLKRGY